jgi:flagellar basal-body rod protein FlgB
MAWLDRAFQGMARPQVFDNLGIGVMCGPGVQTLQEVPMIERLTQRMEFFSNVLQLRAHRQQVIASNIANADTPGYAARDFDFKAAIQDALRNPAELRAGAMPLLVGSDARHLRTVTSAGGVAERTRVAYTVQTQPSLDGNSVDMDQQRANFIDNAIQYESTLRFINGHVRTMLSAIQGQ